MSSKNDLIVRLERLSSEIGRELDTSGTVADLELRIREAEEELSALQETSSEEDSGNENDGQNEKAPVSGLKNPRSDTSGLVRVKTLRTVALTVQGKNGMWRAEVVKSGSVVTLQQQNYDTLAPGIVSEM